MLVLLVASHLHGISLSLSLSLSLALSLSLTHTQFLDGVFAWFITPLSCIPVFTKFLFPMGPFALMAFTNSLFLFSFGFVSMFQAVC